MKLNDKKKRKPKHYVKKVSIIKQKGLKSFRQINIITQL